MTIVNRHESDMIVNLMAGTYGSAAVTISITARGGVSSAEDVEATVGPGPGRQQRRPTRLHRCGASWLFELAQPRAPVKRNFHEQ